MKPTHIRAALDDLQHAGGQGAPVTAEPTGLAGLDGRYPSVRHFAPLFAFGHLPDRLRDPSEILAETAAALLSDLPDGQELSAGLRKLLEAKDCFVRAALPPSTGESK